jgi:trigger factor
MQLSCVKIDGANAKIEGVIVADAISSKIDGIALKASKTVKMDGFRKGKVPVSAVKAKYMADFQQEARSEVLRYMISEGL